ncbi:methionine ABC transporter permease [Haploplasma axanthum]|uniref:Methionine import system permease protein MetP n=1 Tax=Haploplasma axanthum TaxID=29552 RepID=A0A449BCT6_HAPAX|nr:ABC transporter permease subunit [Haploplasma axanthum]VEU80271.1 Methionine import system permease protein MetP [Haploplasma axanthum]
MKLTPIDKEEIIAAFGDTVYLLFITAIFVIIFGILIGFTLYFTERKTDEVQSGFIKITNRVISFIIDIARSIPFIILMVVLIPITVIIVGTMLGAKAALPALIISATPFYGRIVYMSLRDVNKGKLEALRAMGASNLTVILYMTKEALPSLISGLTVTLVTLVGFITSAGAIGAGGLGDLAVKRAFGNNLQVAYICVLLVLIIVFVIQLTGDYLSKKIDKR